MTTNIKTCSLLDKEPLKELLSSTHPLITSSISTTSLEIIDKNLFGENPIEKFRKWNLILEEYFENSQDDPEKLQELKQLVDAISENPAVIALSKEINKFNSTINTIQDYKLLLYSPSIPIKHKKTNQYYLEYESSFTSTESL